MKKLLFLSLLFVSPLYAANDVYLAQSAAGSASGKDCGNPFAVSYFNNAANWSATPTVSQIGPDTVVHLCGGTYTGAAGAQDVFFFQASGTSGHPITLLFEPGAVLTSPVWGSFTGAPITNHQNFIVIDGGTNGIIQNTANGSGLAFNQNSNFIFSDGHDVTIQNFHLTNLCVHLSFPNDEISCSTSGVQPYAVQISGSNVTVQNNVISNTFAGVFYSQGASDSGVVISGNTISNMNWGIGVGLSAGSNSGTLTISGNNISTAANWDEINNNNHHNCIFLFQGSGGAESGATNIYNNYCHGNFGVHQTSHIFIDPNGGTVSNVRIFNNILDNAGSTNGPGNGFITGTGTSGGQVYNNTIFCNSAGQSGMKIDNSGAIVKNNIISTCPIGIFVNSGSSISTSNNNVLYNLTGSSGTVMSYNGTNYASVAAWQAGTTFDGSSSTSNPNLNAFSTPIYQPQAGSSAILLGANLTALGITPLNSDYLGVARPAPATLWTAGAYQVAGATAPVLTLTPSTVGFGSWNLGSTSTPISVSVANTGTAAETLSTPYFTITTGNSGDFHNTGGSCSNGAVIAAGGACTWTGNFTPSILGAESSLLTIQGTVNATAPMTGTGSAVPIPVVTLGPRVVNFGTINTGTSSGNQSFTLTNTGTATLNITSILSSSVAFPLNSITCGATLAASASCGFNGTFAPSVAGVQTATITLISNAASSPDTISLTGTGFTPAPSPPPAPAPVIFTQLSLPLQPVISSVAASASCAMNNKCTYMLTCSQCSASTLLFIDGSQFPQSYLNGVMTYTAKLSAGTHNLLAVNLF